MSDKVFDPVCGMEIEDTDLWLKILYNNKYFCWEKCKSFFIKDPKKYDKNPILKLVNLRKSFKLWTVETEVLKGISFNIWPWEFVAIVWASGSWKSTSLNMIWLLDKQSSGEIFLNWENLSSLSDSQKSNLRSTYFWFVFQQYNLMPWLNAYENITLPLIFAEKDSKIEKIQKHIKHIWLEGRMEHKPFELSWGEQQRVALLRALVNNPQIIIWDEPTWNLDSATWEKILEILINLNRTEAKTLIIVTHDKSIAQRADRIITLKDWKIIKTD